MNNRTKLTVVICVLLVAALIAGCTTQEPPAPPLAEVETENQGNGAEGGIEEAFAVYQAMMAAMEDISSVVGSSVSNMLMQMDGESFSISQSSDFQVVMRSATDIDMIMTSVSDMGELGVMTSSAYFRGGYMYLDMGEFGGQMRMPLDIAVIEEQMASAMGSFEFSLADIEEGTLGTMNDQYVITFAISDQAASAILGDMVDQMIGAMGLPDLGISFSNINFTATIGSDNLPIEQVMDFSMTMSVEGEDVYMNATSSSTFTAFNTLTEIDFPANLDDFGGMDWGDIAISEVEPEAEELEDETDEPAAEEDVETDEEDTEAA